MANIKVVVGLGNPGAQYENTPHSVGFEAIDKFAAHLGVTWELKKSYNALVGRAGAPSHAVLLIKPQTFMNLSGEAVAPIVKYSNATAADLIVVQDDIDMAFGTLKIKKGGSCGGHNGIRNIIERLGTPDFVRVKIGVGKSSDVVAHVLGKFSPENRTLMSKVTDEVPALLELLLKDGPDKAMNKYNGWKLPQ